MIVFSQFNYTKPDGFVLFYCQILLNFQGAYALMHVWSLSYVICNFIWVVGCIPTAQESHLPGSARAAPIACGAFCARAVAMQAYHYPLPLVIARSSCKLGVQTDRTRSRSLCRGHGVSSDVLAKVRTSQTKSDSICFHYTYCRKYPNPITKNFSFFLKFFSSFYVRQVGGYAARWRPVFRSAVLCIDTKAR